MEKLEKLIAEVPINQKGLRACPFCGSSHILVNNNNTKARYSAFCRSIGCHGSIHVLQGKGGFDTEEEAIQDWNSRPREQKLAAICLELKSALKEIAIRKDWNWDKVSRTDSWCREMIRVSEIALARAEEIAGE